MRMIGMTTDDDDGDDTYDADMTNMKMLDYD